VIDPDVERMEYMLDTDFEEMPSQVTMLDELDGWLGDTTAELTHRQIGSEGDE